MIYFFLTLVQSRVVVFHGLGDSCSNQGMKDFSKKLGGDCIEVGNGASSSFFEDFKLQADDACKQVKERFYGEQIVAVGLSQGGLIARYIATECEFGGQVKKLVSIGGPQMGVSAFPHCTSGIFCYPLNALVKNAVYYNVFQNHVGPAGYFRDNTHLKNYLQSSHFLPDLNNERNFSQERKQRVRNYYQFFFFFLQKFLNLDGVLLLVFLKDSMIYPKETAIFQILDENGKLLPLEESTFYKEDLLGFRTLKEQGKVKVLEVNDDHLRMGPTDIDEIIKFI